MPLLEFLDADSNSIRSLGATLVFQSLLRLEYADIRSNNIESLNLTQASELSNLYIGNHRFEDNDFDQIASFLPHLRLLSISITRANISALVSMISRLPRLQELKTSKGVLTQDFIKSPPFPRNITITEEL